MCLPCIALEAAGLAANIDYGGKTDFWIYHWIRLLQFHWLVLLMYDCDNPILS